MYEIGKEYDFKGEIRLVTGIDGQGYPITVASKSNSNSKLPKASLFNSALQTEYDELKLELEKKEDEIAELKRAGDNMETKDKTEIAADIFCIFDPLKLPSSDELKKIAEYLGYTVNEDATKADIIKLIRKK